MVSHDAKRESTTKSETSESATVDEQRSDGPVVTEALTETDPGFVTLANIESLDDVRLFINRELSLLAFQWRVLEEAQDASNPLLERFKFLSIVGSNMDEFFMVRVAGLKRQLEAKSSRAGADGLKPGEALDALGFEVNRLLVDAQRCLRESLMPALTEAGIRMAVYNDLNEAQKADMRQIFLQKIFPVLTPMAFDPGHPFPHISNLSLNLAVLIRKASGEVRFARVKIPDTLPQLIEVSRPDRSQASPSPVSTYMWLDDLVMAHLDSLFPGMTIVEAHPFHVTRDAEVEIQEWEAADLLETTEEGIRQRRFGDVVRLQVDRAMPAHVLEILMSNLQVQPGDVYLVEGHFPLQSLKHVGALDRPDLKFKPFVPYVPNILNADAHDEDEFAAIARRDILLHHPYDSFQPVVNFLNNAATDPSVLAIKMTLYRVGRNSPVVEALLRAMENGKQVAVVVELKARFDEESNIEWARALEREGVHVVYGLIGLKIHAKVLLVVRRVGDSIKRYVHFGTGNYNPVTAHLYTDLCLFSSDETLASDVTDLFNYLTGYSAKTDYNKLLVAPINLRQRIEALIEREIQHQENGGSGHIIIKANALVDDRIIKLLYRASRAGVKIDLIIRGICCLRPGIKGVSENIKVVSVVGRFLEHSRVLYFRNGGHEEIYIGSADMMPRNLDRRVEVLVPIEDPGLATFIREELLATTLADRVKSRIMQPDGNYIRYLSEDPSDALSCQQFFIEKNIESWSER
ncbi:MAG: polyphosphate kinase 1 [Cyanobacteria bacterium HKST-UBA02]|nr:polyphosphate kinase 1 [Cyanobacteria bacterium HKST-UBA02]